MAGRSIKARLEALEAAENARREAIIEPTLAKLTEDELALAEAYIVRRDATPGGTQPTPEEKAAMLRYDELYCQEYLAAYGVPYPCQKRF